MKENVRDFLITTLSGRAALYEYLSLIFREPPGESFIGLSGKFAGSFGALAESCDSRSLKEGAELLKKYAAEERADDKAVILRELNSRYTALFLLGFSSVPPTASGMLTPGCVMRQEPWEKTLKVYKRWNYKMPSGFREPEDHISAQLRFMEKMSVLSASMAEKGDDALMEVLKAQADFLKNNMAEWVRLFCRMLKKRAGASECRYSLYEAGASLAEGYIEEDIKLLDMLTK